jgi:hypothetical protein
MGGCQGALMSLLFKEVGLSLLVFTSKNIGAKLDVHLNLLVVTVNENAAIKAMKIKTEFRLIGTIEYKSGTRVPSVEEFCFYKLQNGSLNCDPWRQYHIGSRYVAIHTGSFSILARMYIEMWS